MNPRMVLTCLLLLVIPSLSHADEPAQKKTPQVVEWRQHFVLRHPQTNTVHFEITEVVRSADEFDENHVLVHDLEHGRFLLDRRSSFAEHEISFSISDVTKKEFVRVESGIPFSGKTRQAVIAEAAQHPELRVQPTPVTVITNGGEWRSLDADVEDWERLRQLRYSIRRTVSAHLLEEIERMRGTVFATTTGSAFYAVAGKFIVYQNGDESLQLEQTPAAPNCEFDHSFGYACSERQRNRVDAAAKAGQRLDRY